MHESVRVHLRAMNDEFRAMPSGPESSSNAVVANTDGSMADPTARGPVPTSSLVRFVAGHRVILNQRS